jgi:hypothetical protein
VQTMGRQAPAVVFSEVISSVIAIAIAIASLREPEMRRVHWQGPRLKEPRSASSSVRRRTCAWVRWWYGRELKTRSWCL